MTTLTTPEAQKFLAEQLKDKIHIETLNVLALEKPLEYIFLWKPPGLIRDWPRILDAEWDSITRLVEGKLTFIQLEHYYTELYKIWVEERPVKCRFSLWLIKLDYIQRATALKQTIGKE